MSLTFLDLLEAGRFPSPWSWALRLVSCVIVILKKLSVLISSSTNLLSHENLCGVVT
jgi:hypothetical protein